MGRLFQIAVVLPLSVFVLAKVIYPLVLRANVEFGEVPTETQMLVDDWLSSHQGTAQGPSGQDIRPLTTEELESYHRDGFLVVRKAVDPSTVQVLRALVDYWLDYPNLPNKISAQLTCQMSEPVPEQLMPIVGKVFTKMPLHWIAKQAMNASALTLTATILHATTAFCNKGFLQDLLHPDMNTSPYTMNRGPSEDATFGENTMVAWIALDQMGSDTVTMKMAKKSHRYYTDLADAKAGGRTDKFVAADFCNMWMNHLDEYRDVNSEIHDAMVEVDMEPGDALLFHGLTYHSPQYTCKTDCNRYNTRRITLRYLDSDITHYRSDIPSQAMHSRTRRCGPMNMGGCYWEPGDLVDNHMKLPQARVVDTREGGKVDLLDYWARTTPKVRPWYFYVNDSPIIHHDTCGVEKKIIAKYIDMAKNALGL